MTYLEDYAQSQEEWIAGKLQRRSHRPVFDVIFIYSQRAGTLDIYLQGDKKPVPDLRAIFAQVVLGTKLGPDEKDNCVYELNPLRSRSFNSGTRQNRVLPM